MGRLYSGWYVVSYTVLARTLLVGATMSTFGLYVLPVSREFGLSRADMNTAIILVTAGSAVMAPFIGWLLDRLPIRPILATAILSHVISLVAISLSHSLLACVILIAGPLTLGYAGSGAPLGVLIVRWFERSRGRAITLGAIGLSLGGIVMGPILGYLIPHYGWRTALQIAAAAVAVVMLAPLIFLRERPSEAERRIEAPPVRTDAPAVPQQPSKPAAILREPQFWALALGAALPLAISTAVSISLTPLAVEGGLSLMHGASLISIAGVVGIGAKLVLAPVADRLDRVAALTSVILVGAVTNVLLLVSHGYPLLVVSACSMGLSSGVLIPLLSALVAERFGAASYGTVYGLLAPVLAAFSMLLTRGVGEIFDRTGGYDMAFATFAVLQIAAAGLVFSLRFVRPARAAAIQAPAGL